MNTSKRCPKCEQFFPATPEFFYSSQGRLRYQCKECVKAQRRADRERRTEYMRHYRQTPKNKAYQKKRNAEYNLTHKEQIRQQQKGYHEQNKEQRNAQKRQDRKSNPELFSRLDRAHKHKRKAQKLASGGCYTAQDIQDQYTRQKGKCYYCHVKLCEEYHVEHVVPLNRGGSNGPDNIVLACPSCNMSKHDKLPHEWPYGNRLL